MSETTEEAVAPLVKTLTVPVHPARAFELFTAQLNDWWPLATHSVGEADAESVTLEPRLGGRIVETHSGGRTDVWGTVTAWEPPRLVGFTWHPGRPAAEATAVTVSFTATSEGATSDSAGAGTTVVLTHSGWEARPDPVAARGGYDSGWDLVLSRFSEQLCHDPQG